MMNGLDRFVLTEDLPEHGLSAGDLGNILMVYQPEGDYSDPEGYTAEFTFLTGETRAVVDVRPERSEEVLLECAPIRCARPGMGRSPGPRSAREVSPPIPKAFGTTGLKPRTQTVRAVMTHAEDPLTVEQVAQHFHRACRSDVRELLETLAALGHVEATDYDAYAT